MRDKVKLPVSNEAGEKVPGYNLALFHSSLSP